MTFSQSAGTWFESRDCCMTMVSKGAISSEHVFSNTAGMLSAPHAFLGSSFFSSARTPVCDMSVFGIGGNGDGPSVGGVAGSSLVKTDVNCALSISALSLGSVAVLPSATSVPTLLALLFLIVVVGIS